jgi:hypothetical protein
MIKPSLVFLEESCFDAQRRISRSTHSFACYRLALQGMRRCRRVPECVLRYGVSYCVREGAQYTLRLCDARIFTFEAADGNS